MSPEAEARLQRIQELQPNPNLAFDAALAQEAVARARRFIAGVKFYRQHPVRREDWFHPSNFVIPENVRSGAERIYPESHLVSVDKEKNGIPGSAASRQPRNDETGQIIWQAGTTVLRDYNPRHPELPPILVIPSLINRFEILDLDRNNSFLRALAGLGFRPLVIDWNAPGEEENKFSLTDYVTKRLIPALDIAAANNGSAQILGYCMGGLLALALAAARPQQARTLTLMATPWDFHKPDPSVGPQFLDLAQQVEPHLEVNGQLPVDLIQSLFAVFQPMQVVAKFAHAATLDPASLEARQFVLLEDWLNEGIPLAAPVARECLVGWYGENKPAKIEWQVAGKIIDPRQLAVPTYVLVPGKDRIVPPESAKPLAKLIPHATLHEPMMGHIGLIASQKAPQHVWAPLIKWLKAHA